jgi:hypothetical protein
VGPWREGPSSTTGHGENHHDRPRHRVFTANKVSKKWVLPPNTNVEHKYILSTNIIEELRWVNGGKGQVAQHDMVKTTMPGPDTGFSQPI